MLLLLVTVSTYVCWCGDNVNLCLLELMTG